MWTNTSWMERLYTSVRFMWMTAGSIIVLRCYGVNQAEECSMSARAQPSSWRVRKIRAERLWSRRALQLERHGLLFCLLFLFRGEQNSSNQHLSVGGIHSPVHLQSGDGDPYCKEGKSWPKKNPLLWICFQTENVSLFAVLPQKDSPN